MPTEIDPTHAALLAAVLDRPDDDGPRLVYADYLDDQGTREGRDRAEFIRVQVRLARLRTTACEKCGNPTDFYRYTPRCRGEVCRLRMREYYTGRRYTVWDWCRGLPAGSRPVYRRGFVAAATFGGDEWVASADAALAAHPLRAVTLATVPDWWWVNGDGVRCRVPTNRMQLSGRERVWPVIVRDPEQTRVAAVLAAEWPGVVFGFDLAIRREWQLTVNGMSAGVVTWEP